MVAAAVALTVSIAASVGPNAVCYLPCVVFRGNNEEFLSRTLKYALRKKWSHLLTAYKTAIAKLKLDMPKAAAEATSNTQQQGNAADVAPAEAAGSAGRGRAGSKGKAGAAPDSKPSKKRKVAPTTAAAGVSQPLPTIEAASTSKPKSRSTGTTDSTLAATLSSQLIKEWRGFAADLDAAERASAAAQGGFAFAFVEGALVKALKHGWWLLLDEINLAPPEVLERIAGILEAHAPATDATAAGDDGDASTGLLLVERGE